jgi:protocatechuate 3,4-dioxygenase, alpha subunit
METQNILLQTPSQTVGPYFAYGLTAEQYRYNHNQIWSGVMAEGIDTIQIIGRVLDGKGDVIPDALVEFWQSDIKKLGRVGTGTDAQGRFIFTTTKPQSINGEAPHIDVIVLMRGLLVHAYTRLYFADEATANATDPLLQAVPTARQKTLLAVPNGKVYSFDICMQGENETVFFDF